MLVLTKVCTKCNCEKALTEFGKKSTGKYGAASRCKLCVAADNALYVANNKARVLAAKAAYRSTHKGYMKEYYAANKERVLAIKRKSAAKRKPQKRAYLARNRAHIQTWWSSPVQDATFLGRLPPVDAALMLEGVVSVVCKKCGLRMTPSRRELHNRIAAFEGRKGGECNFYCSDSCRDSCVVFNLSPNSPDPRLSNAVPSMERKHARKCTTSNLKQLQCTETRGQSYCEKCGDYIDVELHHTLPVAEFGKEAVNPAGHMLLCAGCHTALHSTC